MDQIRWQKQSLFIVKFQIDFSFNTHCLIYKSLVCILFLFSIVLLFELYFSLIYFRFLISKKKHIFYLSHLNPVFSSRNFIIILTISMYVHFCVFFFRFPFYFNLFQWYQSILEFLYFCVELNLFSIALHIGFWFLMLTILF